MRALALTILCALATSGTAAQSGPKIEARSLERVVRALVDSGFSGVVLVTDHDSVVLRRAYGRSATHLNEASTFWIASITKSFTAAAVMRLQTQGRLTVHDSLPRFFPS